MQEGLNKVSFIFVYLIDEGRHSTHDYQNTRRGQLSEEEGNNADAEGLSSYFKTKSLWLLVYFFFKQKHLSCLSAEADTEWHRSPDLQDFLLQSSDEEDVCSLELSDPQLDLEADVMAYFDKNPRNNARQQREKLSK